MTYYYTQIQPLSPCIAQFVWNYESHDSLERSYYRRMRNRGKVPKWNPQNHVTN